MDSSSRRHGDTAVAVGVAAVLAVVVSAEQGGGAGVVAYLWAAALGALMFWRRRYARTVLVLTILGLFAYYAEGLPAIGVAVPVAAALYSAAEAGHRRAAVAGAATVLVVSVVFRLLEGQDFRYVVLYEGIGHAALMTAAIMLGELVRARRRIDALTERHIALEAERRLSEHKQILSRDLHDSIGHTLTVAAIHTSVAQQEARRHPEAAASALDHVSEAVSQALAELRATVRELRAEPRSLRDVEALAETARVAGFHVRTRVEPVEELEMAVTAYRLVQEAVTNSLRHSGGRRITIDVWHANDDLKVLVEDDGRPAGAVEEHAGLTGLRERVTALGGHLDTGPSPRGWQVSATLPLAAALPHGSQPHATVQLTAASRRAGDPAGAGTASPPAEPTGVRTASDHAGKSTSTAITSDGAGRSTSAAITSDGAGRSTSTAITSDGAGKSVGTAITSDQAGKSVGVRTASDHAGKSAATVVTSDRAGNVAGSRTASPSAESAGARTASEHAGESAGAVIAPDPTGNSACAGPGQAGQFGQSGQSEAGQSEAGLSEAAEFVRAGEPTPTPSQPRESTSMLETS